MVRENREAALAAARLAVLKKHGEGAVAPTSSEFVKLDVISSGSILLDRALGQGGFPRGRLIELFGPPMSGKSTLSLCTAVGCQQLGLPVLYLDYEMAFDPKYATTIGVSLDESLWVLSQPETMEQGLDIAETFIEQAVIGVVIVDSLAAMTPKKILEGEIDDAHVAVQARLMAQALQRLTHKIHQSQAVVLFINHIRDVISTMPGRVPRKTTPGGSALKFYSSIRVELQPVESIKGKIENLITGKMMDGPVAVKVRALVVKNKTAMPYREGTFYLEANKGLGEARTVLEVAEGRGLIRRNGSRYILPFRSGASDKPVNLGGINAALDYLTEHPLHYSKLRKRVLDLVTPKPERGWRVAAADSDTSKPVGSGEVREVSLDVEDIETAD